METWEVLQLLSLKKMKKISEGDEYSVTKHNHFVPPINIVNDYSEVESRTPLDKVETKWNEVLKEIIRIEQRQKSIVLIGYFNHHLNYTAIKGNYTPKSSHGGKLIEEFLSSGEYILLNGTNKTVGGWFTRYDPSELKNHNKKSSLDLVIQKLSVAIDSWNKNSMSKEMLKLKTVGVKKGRTAAVFKLHAEILGSKISQSERIAIEDPDTGLLIDSPEKIKSVSLKYCKDLMTNREPRNSYEEMTRRKISRKYSSNYKFILKGGESLMNALFALFFIVWKEEKVPVKWLNSELVQIFKGCTQQSVLDNSCFIHMKMWN